MRILIITQLFDPEPNYTRGLDFARALRAEGHEVEVLTGYPNYPYGKLYDCFRMQWWDQKSIEGISITRVAMILPGNGGFFTRILSYLSLAFTLCLPGMFLVKRPDLVHVYQGPATLYLPALIGRLFGWKYLIDLQDLWPESLYQSIPAPYRWITLPIGWWCLLAYRYASGIVVLSEGYRRRLLELQVSPDKIDVVLNWAQESHANSLPGREQDPFIIELLYAGNLGPFQGLETVLEAAKLIQEKGNRLKLVFIGAGSNLEKLRSMANHEGLDNVTFESWMPWPSLVQRFTHADGLLMHLREDSLTRIAIPSKTQAYLCTGLPMVAAVPGETATLLNRAGVRWVCKPDQPHSLAAEMRRFISASTEERNASAQRAQKYYLDHFSFSKGLAQFLESYKKVRAAVS
jgi:colanic acid biosynthesis glycosyl transferase WcaI